jgi:hypothetical protein
LDIDLIIAATAVQLGMTLITGICWTVVGTRVPLTNPWQRDIPK